MALIEPPPFRQVLAATIEGLLANAAIGFGSGDRGPRGAPAARAGAAGRRLRLHLGRARRRGAGAGASWSSSPRWRPTSGRWRWGSRAWRSPGYLALLGGGRCLVPRLGRWPRVQRALSSGLAGVDAAPGGGHGGAVAARVGERARDAGAVPGRLPSAAQLPHRAADAGGDQRRHRHPDAARKLRHLRGRRRDGAGHVRRAARRRRLVRAGLSPDPRDPGGRRRDRSTRPSRLPTAAGTGRRPRGPRPAGSVWST